MSKTFDKLYEEWVEPYTCGVCHKCWRYLSGKSKGRCVHGGPYLGYVNVDDAGTSKDDLVPALKNSADQYNESSIQQGS